MEIDEKVQVLSVSGASSIDDFARALRKLARVVAVTTVAQHTLIAETFPLKTRDSLTQPAGWFKPRLAKTNGKRKRNPDRWR